MGKKEIEKRQLTKGEIRCGKASLEEFGCLCLSEAARFRSLFSKSELIDFIAFYRVTRNHAPRKGRGRTELDYR